LQSDNINSLANVITLDIGLHDLFGQLKVWFEAVPVRCAFLSHGLQLTFFHSVRPGQAHHLHV
jgi:hypothetical protein